MLIPIAVTVVVVRWIVTLLGSLVGFLPLPLAAKVLVGLAFVVLVGWAAGFWGTRWIVRYSDELLGRIPLVRTIYGSARQMSEALANPSKFLGRPVLVPVGGEGTLVLGFFVEQVRLPHDPRPWACVFVPMSLNLTGGFNLFVPLEQVIDVPDVDREQAFRFVLTAGASLPPGFLGPAGAQSKDRA